MDLAKCKTWLIDNIGPQTEQFAAALVELGMERLSDLPFVSESDLKKIGFTSQDISTFMSKVSFQRCDVVWADCYVIHPFTPSLSFFFF